MPGGPLPDTRLRGKRMESALGVLYGLWAVSVTARKNLLLWGLGLCHVSLGVVRENGALLGLGRRLSGGQELGRWASQKPGGRGLRTPPAGQAAAVAPTSQQRGLLSLPAPARRGHTQGLRVSCSVAVSGQRPGLLLALWELAYDSAPDLPLGWGEARSRRGAPKPVIKLSHILV